MVAEPRWTDGLSNLTTLNLLLSLDLGRQSPILKYGSLKHDGTGDFSAFTGIRSDVLPESTGGNSGNITLEVGSAAWAGPARNNAACATDGCRV